MKQLNSQLPYTIVGKVVGLLSNESNLVAICKILDLFGDNVFIYLPPVVGLKIISD